MLESLKERIDKGVEYAFMTSEKVAKAAREMAKEHNLTKEEGKKLLDHLLKKSEETKNYLETNMQELVKSALEKMNAPLYKDMKKLEDRVKKLESTQKVSTRSKPVKKNPPVAGQKKAGKKVVL